MSAHAKLSRSSPLSQFSVETIAGAPATLAPYAGQVLLIVNTASKCAFTRQYAGLEQLQERYHSQGFDVLGFPCNQFGAQEPGAAADIEKFCALTYGVKFPLFAKIDVNGPNAHPLFQYLTKRCPGIFGSQKIKWNFTKFLVDREGSVISRYSPRITPSSIAPAIERLL